MEECLLLSVGTHWIKLGIAAEPRPRVVIDWFKDRCAGETMLQLVDVSVEEPFWRMALLRNLKKAFDRLFEVAPKGNIVVLIEDVCAPEQLRWALHSLLNCEYRAAKVISIPSLVAPLLAQGLDCGFVVDIGGRDIRVGAVAFGCLLPKSVKFCRGRGASLVQRWISRKCSDIDITSTPILPSILYCRPSRSKKDHFVTEESVTIEGICIKAEWRWKATETLFNNDELSETEVADLGHPATISELMIESYESLEMVVKSLVVQNILVVGAFADMPGLQNRVVDEFSRSLPTTTKVHDWVRGGTLEVLKSDAAWLGASIYCSVTHDLH